MILISTNHERHKTVNNQDYNSYAESFIKDGMVPLSYEEWVKLSDPEETVEGWD